MKKIRTITLNPCFDLHYTVPDFRAERENLVTEVEIEAGGKGINTSRALTVCGVDNLAYVVVGSENGAAFLSQLEKDGMQYRAVTVPGRLRENITVHPGAGKETRISLNTFCVSKEAFSGLAQEILTEDPADLLICFSGRLPKGIDKATVLQTLQTLTAKGAKLAVDSASFTPEDLRRLHPWFIKPNDQEIEAFIGESPKTALDAALAARALVEQGVSETVMISLGGNGAAYSNGSETRVLHIPRLENPLSTIGAGDSTVAGLLAGTAQELPLEEMLRLAVSYGTAACMTPGTLPPRAEDVKAVFAKTRAETV